MGYLQDVDGWLEEELDKFANALEKVESEEEAEEVFNVTKKILKEKILESYHNGRDSTKSFVKKSADNLRRRFSRTKYTKPRR